MRYLILPMLFVMLVTTLAADAQGLEDFKSFSRAIGKKVSVVDRSGLIREGTDITAGDGIENLFCTFVYAARDIAARGYS